MTHVRRIDRDDSQRGAVLPIMALLLVALLAMAAIVVDLGAARETRRGNQSSVDAIALGAAQDLPDETTALTNALTLATANFGFTPNLNNCTGSNADPHALAVAAPGENCITFDAGGGQIRVYYPGTYKTAFGGVINANTLSINTGATASKSGGGFGGVLPFGIPIGTSAGHEVCLKTDSGGGAIAPCNTPSGGNFHYLDIAQYGNTSMGTPQRCATGSHDALFRDNVAMGADHLLKNYAGTTVQDAYITCPTYNAGPDQLATETGNIASLITSPLLTDGPGSSNESDGLGARLRRGNFVCSTTNSFSGWAAPYSCGTTEGVRVDDVPLWHFIGTGSDHTAVSDVPTSCQYSVFTAKLAADAAASVATRALDMRTLLDTCFQDYETGDTAKGCTAGHSPCQGVLFGYNTNACNNVRLYDIQCTPRFGYTPVVCNTFSSSSPPYTPCSNVYPSGSSGNVFIVTKQPIFIQRITDNQAGDLETNDKGNALDNEPGVKYSSPGTNDNVVNIIALPFDKFMLPGNLSDADATNETDVNTFVSLVR